MPDFPRGICVSPPFSHGSERSGVKRLYRDAGRVRAARAYSGARPWGLPPHSREHWQRRNGEPLGGVAQWSLHIHTSVQESMFIFLP